MNENLPEPGADGAAEAGAAPEPVATPPEAPAAAAAPAGGPPIEEPAPLPVADLEPVHPEPPAGGGTSVRRQNRVAILATVALLIAIAFGGGFASGRLTAPAPGGGETAVASVTPEGSGAPAASGATGSATPGGTSEPSVAAVASAGPDLPSDGARLGKAGAPVVIEYWADYQCPYCAKFAQTILPELFPLIKDGTLQVVHRDFAFIGPESIQAAIAVRCAGQQGRYWWMHDAVYAAQNGENKGGFAHDKLIAIGESIGLDTTKLEACMKDHSVLVAVLDDTAAGNRTGVESTPTIDVNGTRNLGVSDAKTLIAQVEAAAKPGATPGALPTQKPTGDQWRAVDSGNRTAGSSSAPVQVQLWMDYQSTDSAAIAKDLEPELVKRATSGAISVAQKDLALLGDESITAAVAVRCAADQGGPAWLLHDVLAVNAQGANSGIYTTDVMLRVASQLGLDVAAFDACMAAPGMADAVKAETAQGKALGLDAGPAIIVLQGGTEVARFTDAIDPKAVLAAIDGVKK